jgi:hypothetical protein
MVKHLLVVQLNIKRFGIITLMFGGAALYAHFKMPNKKTKVDELCLNINIEQLFKNGQKSQIEKPFWGLTWLLASQICKRFYASHGIVPWSINKEGMGFYGILLSEFSCSVNKHPR